MGGEVCSCGPQAVAHCSVSIGEVDAEEYRDGCGLTHRREITDLTCGGDF